MIQTLGLDKLPYMPPVPNRRVFVRFTSDVATSQNQIEIFRTPPGFYLFVTAATIQRKAFSGTLKISLEFMPIGMQSNLVPNSFGNYKPAGVVFLDAQNALINQNQTVKLNRSLIVPEMCIIRLNMQSSGIGVYDPMVALDGFLFHNRVRFPRFAI